MIWDIAKGFHHANNLLSLLFGDLALLPVDDVTTVAAETPAAFATS